MFCVFCGGFVFNNEPFMRTQGATQDQGDGCRPCRQLAMLQSRYSWVNIHELAELIGPLSCIITGDWSEALRLRWTRAGEAAGPPERRIHTSRPGLLCNRARSVRRTMGCGARAGPSAARGSSASRLSDALCFPETN